MKPVYVLGVGSHAWGKFPDKPQLQLAIEALRLALDEAGVQLRQLGGLVAASSRFEGGLGWGLHANEILQAVAETGIPAINVGGGCAAGGIAVHTAAMMIASGECEIVAALGAERMPKGFIPRPPGGVDDITDSDYLRWVAMGATNPAYWALEARRRMHEHGTSEETFAKAALLMRQHGLNNPLARYRKPCSLQEILASSCVSDPLRLLEICAVSDGAAAVILGSERLARRGAGKRIRVAGSAIATGQFGDPAARIPTIATNPLPGVPSTSEVTGAVAQALARASLGVQDVNLIELADNSAYQILAWPELLGFFEPGQSDWMLEHGELAISGRLPVNPSGGFLSFGEATTAQGVLQVCEVTRQLQGRADGHQVPEPQAGLTAILGLGANAASIVLTS